MRNMSLEFVNAMTNIKIQVIFTEEDETADSYIERTVAELKHTPVILLKLQPVI